MYKAFFKSVKLEKHNTKIHIHFFFIRTSKNQVKLKMFLVFLRGVKLSKPQPNLNTTVGLTMKMTLQTPPPTTTQTFQALLDELES